MLTRLEISGFRSIDKLELDMLPLTVLIGPNGSGKSNLLDVFDLLSAAASGSMSEAIAARGGFDVIRFRGAVQDKVHLSFEFDSRGTFHQEGCNVQYKLDLRAKEKVACVGFEQVLVGPKPGHVEQMVVAQAKLGDGLFRNVLSGAKEEPKGLESPSELAIFQVRDQTAHPTPYNLARELSAWRVYPPVSTGRDAPVRRAQLLRAGLRVARDGGNLASVLHAIQNQQPAVWEDLLDVLKTVSPGFHHLSFSSEGGDGTIVLRWWEDPFSKDYGFSANLLSDGTLRLLMILAILLSPDPPPLICIDEPELGLHPDWVKVIGELLQSAAKRTQLIVATHSPELVSKVQPSQVVVVEKENGRTIANRLSDDDFTHWLDQFRLGDLWRTGHVGGRA